MFSFWPGVRRSAGAAIMALVILVTTGFVYNWPQFNGDSSHSGVNSQEILINKQNVSQLAKVFQINLNSVAPGADIADGSPVYLNSVQTPNGVKNLIFVTTKNGFIIALDAQTGSMVWSHQNPAGSCRVNNGTIPCYTTSSPAIDPNHQFVYSYGLDGYAHKYQVGDGTEIKTGGWPELATEKPFNEKGSSALTVATTQDGTSYLYVTNGGYLGDQGDYQGHVTAINLSNGSQNVFNTMCSNQTVHFVETPGTPDCSGVQSAIWARSGVVYDPALNKIFMATGNGTFDPALHDWGDTVFALNPNGTGANGNPLDSYTPVDQQTLNTYDEDLGSTAPAILPVPANSNVQNLAVQGGKDQKLRLINLDNLSGQWGPGHTGGEVGTVIDVPQGGQVLTAPAVWVNPADDTTWVFVANSKGISGLKLSVTASGTPELQQAWTDLNGGTSPILVNGVLFYATPGEIRALDPLGGTQLWSDNQIGGIHWESPIVANGMLYITDESGNLTAYALNGTLPPVLDHTTLMPVLFR